LLRCCAAGKGGWGERWILAYDEVFEEVGEVEGVIFKLLLKISMG